jgi:hypothetical protein
MGKWRLLRDAKKHRATMNGWHVPPRPQPWRNWLTVDEQASLAAMEKIIEQRKAILAALNRERSKIINDAVRRMQGRK